MRTVLIADDEQSSIDIIRFYIEKHNLPLEIVGQAANGFQTIKAIEHYKPDLVFLDIEMPGMNGLEVMERVHAEKESRTAFIIMTAYSSFTYAQQALRLQAKDFLLKPILYDQFRETMHRVLGYRYTDNPLFNQLIEYIDLHFADNLTLSDCAKELAMSPNNIDRLFRNHMNMNFTAYYNSVRIQKAKELLIRGESIKTVASITGFNHLNYFYKVFKRYTGMTPGEYQNKQERISGI